MASAGFDIGPEAASQQSARRHKTDAIEYRFIFSVCFVVLFGAIAIERLIPARWRSVSDGPGRASVFREVSAVAHRYTSIAFQG